MSNLGQFFDQYAGDWDAFYQGDPSRSFDYRNRQRLLLDLVARAASSPADVLELGCGAGHTAIRLAAAGHRVTCIDVSPQMIEATRANFARAGVEAAGLHVGTMSDLPATCGSFDVIVAAGVMEYVRDRADTLRFIHDRLRPGGTALLSFTNSSTPLYWIEVPLKRLAARGAYALTRAPRWRDIAFPESSADGEAGVRRQYEQAGLSWDAAHYFTYGLRTGGTWWPPLWLVRRADSLLSDSRWRGLGRGFFAVGRRSP